MKLNKIQNNPQFGGIKIATAKVKLPDKVAQFELYKSAEYDHSFLRELSNSLDIEKLLPNLSEDDCKLWRQITSRMVQNWKNQETILIAKDNIPCGGLKYSKSKYNYNIDARVTWPIEPSKKEPLAGVVLTLALFKIFMKDSLAMIRTCVAKNDTFDNVSKCIALGFGSGGGDNYNELMSIRREKVALMIEKYKPLVEIEEISSVEDIPFDTFLKIKKD